MAMGSKAVSKRNGRVYMDEADFKEASQAARGPRWEESLFDSYASTSSSSTSTSRRSSLVIVPVEAHGDSTRPALCSANDVMCQATSTGETYPASDADQVVQEVLSQEQEALQPGADALVFTPAGKANVSQALDLAAARPGSGPLHDRAFNFGTVVPGMYRSSYPKTRDLTFIHGLGLKTIVTLVDKDFPEGYKSFIQENGIRHVVFSMRGTKKEQIPLGTMKAILRLVLDQQNHPLLIHCNHGKHRTGCVVAVVRKLSGWELPNIIDEYKTYAEPKVRACDIDYITNFELSRVSNLLARESSFRFRVRNFLRVSVFAFFVLILWAISGAKIASTQKRFKSVGDQSQ